VYDAELPEAVETPSSGPSEELRWNLEDAEDLTRALLERLPLWVKPFICCRYDVDKRVLHLFDRGVRYVVFKRRLLLESLFTLIPNSWVEVKRGRANHVVVTLTSPRILPLEESYRAIRRYFHALVAYFARSYGVKAYIGVLEVCEDGYPNLHGVVFLRQRLPIFRHKGRYRFVHKRRWDRDLKASERGYLDCFALRKGYQVKDYLRRYVLKQLPLDVLKLEGVVEFARDERGRELTKVDFRALASFVFRLLKVKPIAASRGLRRKARQRMKQLLEARLRRQLRRTIEALNAEEARMVELKRRAVLEGRVEPYLNSLRRIRRLEALEDRLLLDLNHLSARALPEGDLGPLRPERPPDVVYVELGYVTCTIAR
jgi:hypothetical protein